MGSHTNDRCRLICLKTCFKIFWKQLLYPSQFNLPIIRISIYKETQMITFEKLQFPLPFGIGWEGTLSLMHKREGIKGILESQFILRQTFWDTS